MAPKKPSKAARAEKKAAEPVDLAAEERALAKKYPKTKIKQGSIRGAGTIKEFGNKRSIEIECGRCEEVRRIATSDLHQVRHCPDCIRTLRLERRKKNRATNKSERPKTATAKTPAKTSAKPKTKPSKGLREKNGTTRPVRPQMPPVPTTEVDNEQVAQALNN